MKPLNENQRRIVLFAVIVTVGSVLILFDIPLTLMIPIVVLAGFGLLVALGAITAADFRGVLGSIKPENLRKISVLRRLDEVKFFEKSPSAPSSPSAPAQKSVQKATPPVKAGTAGEPEKSPGFTAHLRTFVSSISSLGSVLKERQQRGSKVEDINKLLDKTVNEKVTASPLSTAGNVAKPAAAPPGGPGGSALATPADDDPFLSLSGDEFDPGLLDGLDDADTPAPGTPAPGPAAPEGASGSMVGDPGIPLPAMEFSSEADEILKENATPGLEEFSGLEGGDTIDQDFGELDDLEGVDLDGVSLEDDGAQAPAAPGADAASASPAAEASPAAAANPAVKEMNMTDWIPSDAPGEGEGDAISTHADMAAFAGGGGTDEDLLSSIASDVKHTKKEKDISLLRELKDFKAPAGEIEHELSGLYERINAIPKKTKAPGPRPGK